MSTDQLTPSELGTLGRLERIIADGVQSFVEVGNALVEIRDKKLYRARHKTFEAYCQEKWNMGRRQANNYVATAQVVANLGSALPKSTPRPTSVRQAQPLARLPKEEQPAAWKEARETAPAGRPTGKHVEKVVERRIAENAAPAKPKAEKRRPLIDPDVEVIVAMLEKMIEKVNDLARENLGHNNHSRIAIGTLQKAIGDIKAMEKSWRNK